MISAPSAQRRQRWPRIRRRWSTARASSRSVLDPTGAPWRPQRLAVDGRKWHPDRGAGYRSPARHGRPVAGRAKRPRGAVYIHQGATYLVSELDLADGVAIVSAAEPRLHHLGVDADESRVLRGPVAAPSGGHAAPRRGGGDLGGNRLCPPPRAIGEILSSHPLDLPPSELVTVVAGGPYPIRPPRVSVRRTWRELLTPAEHAAIGLLPLVASCDRWDVGGLSCEVHPDTGELTVFIYDGYPGGADSPSTGYEATGDLAGRHPFPDR